MVGWAYAHLKWASDLGLAYLRVVVDPEWRGHGIGSELWARAESHLRALQPHTLRATADAGTEGIAFVEHRFFEPTRRSIISRLNVHEAPNLALRPPKGFELIPLSQVTHREEEMYQLNLAAERDVLADEPRGRLLTFEAWRRETLTHPDLTPDGSFYLSDGERLAAFALLIIDHSRHIGWNEMTGTLPEYRGRGLASVVKAETINWAKSNGIDRILTNNDAENQPILALNRRLGYQPVKILVDYEQPLSAEMRSR